jgi:hypothetical protein
VKLQRYNENWLQIIYRLTSYKPPALSQSELMYLDTIFEGVCGPFVLFKPRARKNLLNYNFMLYRLLQLIGRQDTLMHFPQLKTKSKWEDLDRVWAKICEYNDWEHWEMEPVEPGTSPWLEIATDDALWERCKSQSLMATWAVAINNAPPKKPKPHSYANRKVLESMARVCRHQEALDFTRQPPKKRKPKGKALYRYVRKGLKSRRPKQPRRRAVQCIPREDRSDDLGLWGDQ